MVTNLLKKIFGSSNDRVIKSYQGLVLKINDLENKYQKLSDDGLRSALADFRTAAQAGQSLDALLPDVFALVREASKRTLGMRHFDVQLVGGIVLHQGKIAEMRTGEGKTLVATLPCVLNALSGKGVHVVTVNDYLARRDSEWMSQIYNFLGLSVGVVYSQMEEDLKKGAYAADITYGQNNEFGFDYLRDNMKHALSDLMQRGHNFAIVDEVDSILIDEARTPLIISGPAEDSSELYHTVNKIIPMLKENEHYEIDLKSKQPTLNERGVARVEEILQIENLYEPAHIEIVHHVNQGLKAHTGMARDVDYVVRDGKIVIVDEFTGRLMPGRRWSDGLHQAIEAKEGLKIARENRTLASITFQNYFRLYSKLSGMTGTASTEAQEFKEIYKLDVVSVPTNKPLLRDDQSDVVYITKNDKYTAVAQDIAKIHETGQPVLVGTVSIEQSEELSKYLTREEIPHNVLNAKHHEREAEIIAQAGRWGAVTIATNMAGRGTDILLGGNPTGLAQRETGLKDPEDPAFQEALSNFKRICAEEKARVLEVGGLFILGTERHESRRIDNQLRGRAGRQGDPGTSRFYISLEDDLMRRFAGDRIQQIMKRFGYEEGMAIDGRIVTHSIENAQKKVERFHFESRKHVTEYDDVMNKQRQVMYNLRNRILHQEGVRDEIFQMIEDLIEESVMAVCDDRKKPLEWNLDELSQRYEFLFKQPFKFESNIKLDAQNIFDALREQAKKHYADHVKIQSDRLEHLRKTYTEGSGIQISVAEHGKVFDFNYATLEQDALLEAIDKLWLQHLDEMDHLREGVGLRGYAQKNPKYEYQKEGFLLFAQMLENLKVVVVRQLFHSDINELEGLLAHIQQERARRAALEEQMKLEAPSEAAVEGEAERDPNDQRARLEAQRKERRKQKRRR